MAEADYDTSELSEMFERAAEHLKFIMGKMDTGQLLEFYGYYKQATEGPCNIPKPRWYEMQAKQKWEAWQSLGEMTREAAMKNYIQLISDHDPGWKDTNLSSKGNDSGIGKSGWVAVSSLSSTDEYIDDADKTVFDWVKEGNAEKFREFAQKSSLADSNIIDSEGMGLIHWAADRGHLTMLKCLVKDLTANVDLKDRDGQTALHYAASCGHVDVVKFLLDNGADPNVTDVDGMLPVDVASGSEIVESLTKAN
ncbi:acyl-CoA-binding domain-containing protein 6 [Periplaneta americana]|uniref:acyl-CoA-binding domain-containing protein 6 n=1 Tax=Periplaneta americana TaxID=6978 RepID=UPI0037E9446F